MCMISQEIKSVSATKLFCGVNANKTRQLTVYANTVDNISKNNAMVLPVPFPSSVIFHNLEDYADFFFDCELCFEKPRTELMYKSLSFTNEAVSEKKLEVYDIGSYKVSLAKSLDDLKRVNTNVFVLSKGLDEILKKHYSNSIFGFIICKLAEGNEKYHPFAYSHEITQEKVFIPTRHYHDENINNFYNNYEMFTTRNYTNDNINNSPMFSSWNSSISSNSVKSKIDINDEYADDWDHDIYLYNVNVNTNSKVSKMNTCKEKWNGKNSLNLNKIDFSLDRNCRSFQKLNISGNLPNIDIVLQSS